MRKEWILKGISSLLLWLPSTTGVPTVQIAKEIGSELVSKNCLKDRKGIVELRVVKEIFLGGTAPRLFGARTIELLLAIVVLTLGLVSQNLVGIANFGEFQRGFLLALFGRLLVGVVLQSKLPVGRLDLLLGGILVHSQNGVGVLVVFHFAGGEKLENQRVFLLMWLP